MAGRAMQSAEGPPAEARPGAPRDRPVRYGERVSALLRSRVVDILLIGALTSALDVLRALPMAAASALPMWTVAVHIGLSATVMSGVVIVGISLAQALTTTGWRRVVLMIACGLAAAFVQAALSMVWNTFSPFGVMRTVIVSSISTAMYLAWEYAAVAVAAALFYAAREREAQLASAARASELEHQRVQRTMMESRLAVLRARVEPEFLFAALEDVRGLYRRDGAAADEMLDALIVYLRAALPQMRGEASTIGREIELVSAYVGVLQVPRRAVLHCVARAGIDARDHELPPMVLLPLAQAAFADGEADRRRRFVVEANAIDEGALIRIEVAGGALPAAWRGQGPETVVRTLRAYFGTAAALRFTSTGAVHGAELHLPPPAA